MFNYRKRSEQIEAIQWLGYEEYKKLLTIPKWLKQMFDDKYSCPHTYYSNHKGKVSCRFERDSGFDKEGNNFFLWVTRKQFESGPDDIILDEGDWIVRREDGQIEVLTNTAFDRIYEVDK